MVTQPVVSPEKNITVVIADDHPVVRQGLRTALNAEPGITVVGEASDGLEAMDRAMVLKPDVVIMDVFMPHNEGLKALTGIKQLLPNTRLLVMTVSEHDEDLFAAIKFGAQGYLLKRATLAEVIDAVRKTAAGEVTLSPFMAAKLINEFREKEREPELSQREMEVLKLMGEGLSTAEIATRMSLSQGTVSTYIGRIMDKLHLKSRAEAIVYAARRKLDSNHRRAF